MRTAREREEEGRAKRAFERVDDRPLVQSRVVDSHEKSTASKARRGRQRRKGERSWRGESKRREAEIRECGGEGEADSENRKSMDVEESWPAGGEASGGKDEGKRIQWKFKGCKLGGVTRPSHQVCLAYVQTRSTGQGPPATGALYKRIDEGTNRTKETGEGGEARRRRGRVSSTRSQSIRHHTSRSGDGRHHDFLPVPDGASSPASNKKDE